MHSMKGDKQCIIQKAVGGYQFCGTPADKHLYAVQTQFWEFQVTKYLKFKIFLQKLGSVP